MMCRSIDDVKRVVEEKNISFIKFWLKDVRGTRKIFAITLSKLEGVLPEGMGFDVSSIEGFERIRESDMIAKPVPTSFQLVPWRNN